MPVHVLLFDAGSDSEGIHSLEVSGRTVVLLFEDRDDAERYAGLLEAQDFPLPTVDAIDREEMERFCSQATHAGSFHTPATSSSSQRGQAWYGQSVTSRRPVAA